MATKSRKNHPEKDHDQPKSETNTQWLCDGFSLNYSLCVNILQFAQKFEAFFWKKNKSVREEASLQNNWLWLLTINSVTYAWFEDRWTTK